MAAQSSGGPGDFTIPDALPVLPLRDAVVFPLTAVPLLVQTPSAIRVIDDVMRGKEKVLAAHRVGIRTVILPRHNERDVEDVPAEVRSALRFVFVDDAAEVLRQALTPVAADERAAAR